MARKPLTTYYGNAVCVALLLLLTVTALSQDDKRYAADSTIICRIVPESFPLKNTRKAEYTKLLPLQFIRVNDVRIDSSYLCIVKRKSPKLLSGDKVESLKMNPEAGLAAGLSAYLQRYFEAQLSSGSAASLQCFIKRCRIYDTDTMSEAISKSGEQLVNLDVEMDCYYQQGSQYYPALRIDSLFSLALPPGKATKIADEPINQLVILFSEKLNKLDFNKILNRKVYTADELNNRYANVSAGVAPLQVAVVHKGIYRSFADWVNNKPYSSSYTIRSEKKNTITLYDSEDNIVVMHKIFGISDGRHFWIQSMGSLYPLIRIHNSFEFYGFAKSQMRGDNKFSDIKGASKNTVNMNQYMWGLGGGAIMDAFDNASAKKNMNCLHGLDLETGLFY